MLFWVFVLWGLGINFLNIIFHEVIFISYINIIIKGGVLYLLNRLDIFRYLLQQRCSRFAVSLKRFKLMASPQPTTRKPNFDNCARNLQQIYCKIIQRKILLCLILWICLQYFVHDWRSETWKSSLRNLFVFFINFILNTIIITQSKVNKVLII